MLIYFVALALIPNNAEAKDKSISKKKCDFSIGFHLPKDVGTPGPVCPSMSPRKKHNVMIVSAKDGHPVRDGKKSLRFELRDGDCNPNNKGYDDDGLILAVIVKQIERELKLGIAQHFQRVNISMLGQYTFQKIIKPFIPQI